MFHGLLLSSGFSNPSLFEKVATLTRERGYTRAQILTSAHPKRAQAPWSVVTKEQLERLSLSVSFLDLYTGEGVDERTDVLYVCGGNTFALLHAVQMTRGVFTASLASLFSRGGLYIGSSAGAVLVAPSILSASQVSSDRNRVGISDMTGLGYISQQVIPHYTPSLDTKIASFRTQHGLSEEDLLLLRDGEGLYVHEGVATRIH